MTYPRHIIDKTKKNKTLIVSGSKEDCMAIINRLVAENPHMTISEYLEKYHKEILILRWNKLNVLTVKENLN